MSRPNIHRNQIIHPEVISMKITVSGAMAQLQGDWIVKGLNQEIAERKSLELQLVEARKLASNGGRRRGVG